MKTEAWLKQMNINIWSYWETQVKNQKCTVCKTEGDDIAVWRIPTEEGPLAPVCHKCFGKYFEKGKK